MLFLIVQCSVSVQNPKFSRAMAKMMITFLILKMAFGSLTQAVFYLSTRMNHSSVAGPEADWAHGALPCSAFDITDCISSSKLYKRLYMPFLLPWTTSFPAMQHSMSISARWHPSKKEKSHGRSGNPKAVMSWQIKTLSGANCNFKEYYVEV